MSLPGINASLESARRKLAGGADVPQYQSGITDHLVLSQESTIIFTERVREEMMQGDWRFQTVENGASHLVNIVGNVNYVNSQSFHLGQINYLMMDSHVETVTPDDLIILGTVSSDLNLQSGAWTIAAGD